MQVIYYNGLHNVFSKVDVNNALFQNSRLVTGEVSW